MLATVLLAATAALVAPSSQPVFAAPVIHMDDTVVGTGQNIWSGRPIQAEYVTPSSVLIGKQIDTIIIKLKKTGLPVGDAEIGVFGSDLSVKKLFGTKDVSTLTGSYVSYEFVLSGPPYTIEAGDRIGVKYTGGASTEHISIMRDTDHADPFDGVNSYNSFYNATLSTWSTFALYDLTMTLKLSDDGGAGDTIPPAVTSVSHSPQSPTSSQTVEITATATDNVGLSSVEIFVDGSSIGSCAVSSTSASCVKSGGPYAPGSSHTYSATATDAQGLTSSSAEKTFLVLADGPAPVIHMDDTVVGTGQNIWSGRPAQVEYVTPASSLVGKPINFMTIMLKKSGAPTGIAEIGIINPDLSMKKVFATLDVSTLTTSYSSYDFASSSLYTIEAEDRIGVKYTGGASTEHISIMRDTDHADPFDGVNSYNSFYNSTSTTWSTFALYDLTMTLKGAPPVVSDTTPPIITAAPAGGTYNSAQSVSLSSNEPATIYYTSDGSDPVTSGTRLVYSSSIAISTSTLLKYYGIDNAGNASTPQEQNYIIQQPDTIPPILAAAPSGGTYDSTQSVVLSSNEPATIYYTSDGSNPVTSATRLAYNSPISISASTLLKYYGIDGAGNASVPQEQNYIIQQQPPSPFPIIHMQDTTATVGSVTYAGRQINAEYVTPTSQLAGDKIDSITLRLQKIGAPPGTFQVGVFNQDLTAKKSFAIVSTSTLSTTFQDYEFKLPNNELYTIAAGDRIGIKYNGGSTGNAISVMNDRDPADPFDSNKSYRTRYESFGTFGLWIVSYSEDMYMTLKQTHAGAGGPGDTTAPTITASPSGGAYTSAQSVTLSANEPATIYYTTNGSEPTTSSNVYSSPIPIPSTTTLKFMGVDTAGNASPTTTQVYTISMFTPVTHMSDTTISFASLVSAPRQLMTEYVTPTSQLVGDKIDSITLRLQKVGAPTGTAQVGIFNTDLSVKKLFATINVATISTIPTVYEFKLPAADPLYTIAAGDRIGIKYTGGSAVAGINVTPDRDPANPFDGANSYRARYEVGWINSTGEDLYMILKQTHE